MRRNTSLVCFLTITLLISLSPFAYGEKQDANKPATQSGIFDEISGTSVLEQPKPRIKSFDEIAPSTPEELQLHLKERAFQGDPNAQWELARMYCDGNGVPQDYKQAAKWFTRAAEQGSSETQCNLGRMYSEGQGMPRDYEQAVKWYTKAAEQGYAKAQDELGYMYVLGQGAPQDDKQAVKWWTKAAEQGYANSQHILGLSYSNGTGVPRDDKQAVKWYTKAAEQGYANSQYMLGFMYRFGRGVPQDYQQAVEWFTKAAEQGNTESQVILSVMYDNGEGVPRDYEQADKWWTKATEHGSTYAQTLRDSFSAPPNGMFSDLVEQQAAPVRQTSLIRQIATIFLIGIAICLVLFLIYKYLLKKILRMIRGVLQKRPHLIPAIVAAVMLFVALGRWPDDYYQLLRFVTCCVSVYVAYTAYTWQKMWAVWLFGFIAVLFNPLAPIHFSRELWQYVDIICAVLFTIIVFILRKPAEEK